MLSNCCCPVEGCAGGEDVATGSLNTPRSSLLHATPCKKSGRKSTPAAEEIHRKSAEEILCVSTGNPYKVSLANLTDILQHHHAPQIIQDNLSLARMSPQICRIGSKIFPLLELKFLLFLSILNPSTLHSAGFPWSLCYQGPLC